MDRYKFHKPPDKLSASSTAFKPRRCLALTRGEIVAALQIPDAGVESLLASPFFSPNYEPHNLCCGHRVWCASPRPCARNCSLGQPCRGNLVTLLLPKDADVILCRECVLRAEMVHMRYENVAFQRYLNLADEG
jgi:hypothetical protein